MNKKIYFACSIRGGRNDATTYEYIVSVIKKKADVLTEVFTDGKLTPMGMYKPSQDIWETDIAWIKESDGVIAEVTNPSLGVGYEIAKAEEWNIPVLALYRLQQDRRLSAMIDGSPSTPVQEYTDIKAVEAAIYSFIESLGS